MQIGDSLYIDIEIVDTEYKDFLSYADVIDFKLVETAGASLPYIYMKILVENERIKNSFQENNMIRIKVGNNVNNADSFDIEPINVVAPKDPSDTKWCVEFAGFIGSQSYMQEVRTKAYPGNSLLVVDSVMKEYFGKESSQRSNKKLYITTDFTDVNENQVIWRQNNTPGNYFVTEVLLHADVRPSFPLFSFDRYLNFYVRDLAKLVKDGPSHIFTPFPKSLSNEIRYYNSFNTDSFKPTYNLYSGYNKITEIYNAISGIPTSVVASNEPILAASSESEKAEIGNIVSANNIQSSNVHETYNLVFAYNTNKLVSLSSIQGVLELHNEYYKNIHPTDLVEVKVSDVDDPTLSGKYIVDSVLITADFDTGGFTTYVYVTRDNKNNVENYIPKKKRDWLKIRKRLMDVIVSAVAAIKDINAQAMRIIDGRFLQELMSFALVTKNNVLRSFRIAGVNIDFTSKENLLISLVAEGNALLNLLCDMIFPEEIAMTLKDAIVMGRSQLGSFGGRVEAFPLISLISHYVDLYIPVEIRSIVMTIVQSLCGITDSLNSIAEDNGIIVSVKGRKIVTSEVPQASETSYVAEGQQRIESIITSFENNTTGLDIPFPIIELTESQALFPDDKLKELAADETIQKLEELGYLNEVDKDKFKEILLGNEPIDFDIIDAINKSAGNTFAYRYWGTYESLTDLVDFYIKKSFKDKFRTIPCTKLISALGNTKIFFACPTTEEDLKFYINSKRVELPNFVIDLGYGDVYGNPVLYRVYYTETGYNSSSVMFEVKQGGMV